MATYTPPKTLTQGENFTDLNGNVAAAQYDPNNGSKLASGETVSVSAAPTTVTTPPVIAADSLGNTVKAPVVAPVAPLTQHAGLTSMVTNNNDVLTQRIADEKATADKAAATRDAAGSDYTSLLEQIGGIKQKKDLVETTPELQQKAKEIGDISQQIASANKATQDEVNLISQKNPDGFMGTAATDHINDIQRANASYVANLSIRQSALQGNYTQLVNTATKALDAQLEPLQAKLDARKFVYDNNKELFNDADAKRLKDEDTQLTTIREASKSAVTTISDLMQKGTITAADGSKAISDVLSGKVSLSDVYKNLGIQSSSSGNAPGKIAGIDISKYATDPQHELKVQAIYNNTQNITDAASAQAAIDATGIKNSPVTGDMIINAALTNNVDPKLVFAIMMQDSSLGTAGKGARTFNPGNVGNDDAGNIKNYGSWDKGVNAVASWLSNHRLTGADALGSSDPEIIAKGIINGTQPPVLTGLYGKSSAVKVALEKAGYDLTKATQDWTAQQKLIGTMNGAQQVRLRQAVSFAADSLDLVDQLNEKWRAGNYPILNKANLALAKSGALGQEAQTIATQLDTQIADLTSELGTVYKGGNSSTDESLKLAAHNLSSDYSYNQLKDAITLTRKNLAIRQNSINTTVTAGTGTNSYAGVALPADTSANTYEGVQLPN